MADPVPHMRHDAPVSSYRVAEAADILGVSNDTLRRWIDADRVPAGPGFDGKTRIDGADLATLAKSLAEHGPEGFGHVSRATSVSARNRMRGIVTAVKKDTVMAQVEMVCGPYRLVSLMSAEAADDLGLEPGVLAIASVKSTNVVVELP
jgi:molybdopterin-binding protein